MGWASGGLIFDRVADAFIAANASDDVKRTCLGPLIEQLQEGDWDTEHESLERYASDPVIVGLFAERGITLDEDEGTEISMTTHLIKAATLREFADQIDKGPDVPLRPGVYSALAREKAQDAEQQAAELRGG